MSGGLMKLQRVKLVEQQDELVVNRLQLPPIFVGLGLVGFHGIPLRSPI
jgi:hypothetical protein